MIKVRPFRPEDYEKIRLKSIYGPEKIEGVLGPAFTFLIDEQPIAIFGMYLIGPGLGQVWALTSDDLRREALGFHKAVLGLIYWSFDNWKLRRMQMSVRVGYTEGWKWARSLGFKCEGVMKAYSPDGTDCWLFARVA
jgi:hypothetical protein